ncbi:hypothetical protein [Psychrobacter sp. S1-30-MNA-CIBAN-0213]|uniref:hypothetical protein n=1 Tax=unclassified Psychrobacter TaxID=196806 RepID=UPI00331B5CBA
MKSRNPVKKFTQLGILSIFTFSPVLYADDTSLSTEIVDNVTMQNINRNLTQYENLDLPKLALPKEALPKNASQAPNIYNDQTLCKVGTQRTIDFGPFAHDSKRRAKHSWSDVRQQEYFSSNGWIPDSGKLTITSRSPLSSFSISKVAKDMVINRKQDYIVAQKKANDYVVGLDLPEIVKTNLNAKIDEFSANYQTVSDQLMSSHNGFLVTTTVSGTGFFNLKDPYSWVHGSFAITETCIPPEVYNPDLLEKAYIAWVNSTVASIKQSIDLPKDDKTGKNK